MNKRGWAIVLATIAVVVVAGYFLPQAALAAERTLNSDKSNQVAVGTVVAQLASADMARSPAKGIQKTINIPAAAFTWDGGATGFFNFFVYGGITGSDAYFPCLCAPVIFPKGAKTIVKVEWIITDFMGSSAWCRMFDKYFPVDYSYKIVDFWSSNYGSLIMDYITTPSDTTIYPKDTWYLTACLYTGAKFYGAVVTYK